MAPITPIAKTSTSGSTNRVSKKTNTTTTTTPTTSSPSLSSSTLDKKKTKRSKKGKNACNFKGCTSPAAKFIGDCRFCQRQYCSKHRLMENHACEGLVSCKEEMHKRNADKLSSEQTKSPKIQI
ncbi:hypothetical protein NCAS_0G00560 [Naumovozyma castellii]|uniref:AN1-type domain-containing protein n=1 Tax=Naumovozyma castellii TaxID=27288 RepID=G0VHQ9_NAUCA|nr:hypothetical protein NCAS_0G00560 [Naumovozyma castellii CBS 4309]CCC70943.1 hypothetical protein NCAS_0G00560 [Naumovozyma castellii CBS 4309]